MQTRKKKPPNQATLFLFTFKTFSQCSLRNSDINMFVCFKGGMGTGACLESDFRLDHTRGYIWPRRRGFFWTKDLAIFFWSMMHRHVIWICFKDLTNWQTNKTWNLYLHKFSPYTDVIFQETDVCTLQISIGWLYVVTSVIPLALKGFYL